MADATLLTTDADIDFALQQASGEAPLAAAKRVSFLPGVRLLLLELKDSQRLAIPVEDLEELAQATDEQMSVIELLGPGTGIHFPAFDGNLYVPYLVEGNRGSRRWMEHLRARRDAALSTAA